MMLDTSFMIDFLKGKKEAVDKIGGLLKANEPIRTTAISVFEIWQGISDMQNELKREKIETFLSSIGLVSFDIASAKKAGTLFANLRAKGELIEGTDCMIAAIALSNNEPLLTRNKKHFEKIKDLKLVEY